MIFAVVAIIGFPTWKEKFVLLSSAKKFLCSTHEDFGVESNKELVQTTAKFNFIASRLN